MFKTKLILIIIFFVFSKNMISQSRKLENSLVTEFQILDKLFNDNLLLILQKNCDTTNNYFEIISIDTINFSLPISDSLKKWPAYLIDIGIRVKKNLVLNLSLEENKKKIIIDTLHYTYLSCKNELYKLFGFYFTDINLFVNKYGIKVLNNLNNTLIEEKILTKKQARIFYKCIKNKRGEYSSKIGKPCILLDYFFNKTNKNKANTIILPLEPLLPAGSGG